MLATPVKLIVLLLVSITAFCQTKTDAPTPTRLEFEVASVKPTKPGTQGGGIKPLPGGQTYVATNVPVGLMIRLMFHLNTSQISGGPGWLDTDRYDVDAKADGPHTVDELHVMFQNLLVDRFKLKFHYETKTLPAYELVVDKSGPKITENHNPENFDIPIQVREIGSVQATHCSMSYFSWVASQFLNKPVVDQTGLTGYYDFKLEFAPEIPQAVLDRLQAEGRPAPTLNGPDLFTAIREQMGLRLDSHKGPVQVMVIEHVEKPSEN